jgi:Hypervirulence associated proteins TUDOR domain
VAGPSRARFLQQQKSLATGVFAWMPWRRPVGMWTQGPGGALVLLLGRLGVLFQEVRPMVTDFKRGDHVEWNPEAGRVRGTIQKKVTREIVFKGYKRHASKEEPQYIIKSDKTDHLAIHKGSALKKIKKGSR